MGDSGGDIVIVGVCAAGKSTLARKLQEAGLRARTVAQEHSCIPDLWRLSGALTTVYLHASYGAVRARRSTLTGAPGYEAQLHRLREAREGATMRVDTSGLTPEQVYSLVAARLDADPEDQRPLPTADEPGSDAPPRDAEPAPVPEEPGQDTGRERHQGLPIPEEL
jgi:chloramphenicol 3-O-phosphotransferase